MYLLVMTVLVLIPLGRYKKDSMMGSTHRLLPRIKDEPDQDNSPFSDR